MRAAGLSRQEPRAWPHVGRSYLEWMTDQATILRRVETDESKFGTPGFADQSYGPYAAKIGAEVANDEIQADRHTVQRRYTLAIASDVRPIELDRIRVVEEGGRVRTFRVPGTVNIRMAAWGANPVWNLELQETTEG